MVTVTDGFWEKTDVVNRAVTTINTRRERQFKETLIFITLFRQKGAAFMSIQIQDLDSADSEVAILGLTVLSYLRIISSHLKLDTILRLYFGC